MGELSVDPDGSDRPLPPLGPRRLALLAVVAAAGPRGITREKVLGILWPDSDEEQARHTLSQTLYLMRRDTGAAWVVGTTHLRLGPALASDIGEFEDALDGDRLAHAAGLYAGPFLDGFYLTGAPEFERWVEETRARLQLVARRALETLARRATEAGTVDEAAGWWQRLGRIDPFESTYALGRIRALSACGNRAGALRHAREYESRVRRELDADPDSRIVELIAELQRTSAEAAHAPPLPPAASMAGPAPIRTQPRTAPQPTARVRMRTWVTAVLIAGLLAAAATWRIRGSDASSAAAPPVLAVGSILSRDTTAAGPFVRAMLATNLARLRGIHVVSNSRMVELLPRAAANTTDGIAEAARRAGATEVVEGEVDAIEGGLVLTLRRVALRSGVALQGYTVRAADVFALADSATFAIAYDLGLDPPPGAVATVRTGSTIAYALYEQGLRLYYQGDRPGASRLMGAALARDSTFAMAAFFAWQSDRALNRSDEADRALQLLRRLAGRTVDRERLWIEGTIAEQHAPALEFLGIAREMTDRFPDDPDGQILLGNALAGNGDWAGAVTAYERAIAIDSVAGALAGPYCRVCTAIQGLQTAFAWWDSIGGAERAARRLLGFRPAEGTSWTAVVEPLLRQGRRGEAEAAIARADKLSAVRWDFRPWLDRDLIRWGRLDELEARLVSELHSTPPDLQGERTWLLALGLRNQGRLSDAGRLAADGVVPGTTLRLDGHHDLVTLAIVALDGGRPTESARRFLDMVADDQASELSLGPKARQTAWHMTLAATALAAAGDTVRVRALADSVERIGRASSSGRDHRLHHFLHGLLLQRQNRHAEAVESFRRSLFSTTDGYTRINLEIARSLMIERRHAEAIAILQPALRGGVDGSNTYVTHTELREMLAHAFHATGRADSAAVHYAAVAHAWRRADPVFRERLALAQSRAAPR